MRSDGILSYDTKPDFKNSDWCHTMSDVNKEGSSADANWLEAIHRIRLAEKANLTQLDLGDLCLNVIPPEIGRLTRARICAGL